MNCFNAVKLYIEVPFIPNIPQQKSFIDIKKCYKILGLDTNASKLQIQLRFKELAIKYHPDRNLNSKSAAKKFTEIFEARQRILQAIQVTI